MPDQTVQVTFDPQATQQFTFDPESAPMSGSGKVKLMQKPPNQGWSFSAAVVKNDTLGEFHPSVQADGKRLDIQDDFRDTVRTPYQYNVTVTLNGQSYTSPDPEIVNDPPS